MLLPEPLLANLVFTLKYLVLNLIESPAGCHPLGSHLYIKSKDSHLLFWVLSKKDQVQGTLKEAFNITQLFLCDKERSLVS